MEVGDHVSVRLPMGASLFFNNNGGTYEPPPGNESALVQNGSGDWTLTTKHGLEYDFDSSGFWTSVTDGNATTLTYNASDRSRTRTAARFRSRTTLKTRSQR